MVLSLAACSGKKELEKEEYYQAALQVADVTGITGICELDGTMYLLGSVYCWDEKKQAAGRYLQNSRLCMCWILPERK